MYKDLITNSKILSITKNADVLMVKTNPPSFTDVTTFFGSSTSGIPQKKNHHDTTNCY